jgi:hypothetical protein
MKLTERKIINGNLYKLTYSEEVPLYQLFIIKNEAESYSYLLKDLENRKEFDSESKFYGRKELRSRRLKFNVGNALMVNKRN